jgi:hypothetical protein
VKQGSGVAETGTPVEGFAWRLDLQHHAWAVLNGKALDVT